MRNYKRNDIEKKKEDAKNKKTHKMLLIITSHAHATCAVRETIAWQNATAASGHEFERQIFMLRRMALNRVKRNDKTFTNWRNEGKSNEKICFYSLP